MTIPFHRLARVLTLLFAAHWTTIYCLASQKEALLIANSQYSNFGGGLANAIPDADKLSGVLRNLGFRISIVKNADREEMLEAIRSFEDRVRGTNALAFFHYGGHGVQVDGKNYLLPANADIPDERRVPTNAVALYEVVSALDSASPSPSIIVIDASLSTDLEDPRNRLPRGESMSIEASHDTSPPAGTQSSKKGLSVIGVKPKNYLIIFAAEPGRSPAWDGLFTPILAETILQHSDLSMGQIMQKVRAKVVERSNGIQTPAEYSQLVEEVFLKPTPDTKK